MWDGVLLRHVPARVPPRLPRGAPLRRRDRRARGGRAARHAPGGSRARGRARGDAGRGRIHAGDGRGDAAAVPASLTARGVLQRREAHRAQQREVRDPEVPDALVRIVVEVLVPLVDRDGDHVALGPVVPLSVDAGVPAPLEDVDHRLVEVAVTDVVLARRDLGDEHRHRLDHRSEDRGLRDERAAAAAPGHVLHPDVLRVDDDGAALRAAPRLLRHLDQAVVFGLGLRLRVPVASSCERSLRRAKGMIVRPLRPLQGDGSMGRSGWRARIGMVHPSRGDTLMYEYYRAAPPGIVIVPAALNLKELSTTELDRVYEGYEAAVADLAYEEVDVVVLGG